MNAAGAKSERGASGTESKREAPRREELRAGARRAAVFVNGEYEDEEFYRCLFAAADLTVAADGGAGFLLRNGLVPDVLVGDFDSLAAVQVEELAAAGARVVRHPARKDFTDGEAAIDEALVWGAQTVVLAGALSKGLDHVLGNLAVLRRVARRGCLARLAAPGLSLAVLARDGELAVPAPAGTRVSLLALSDEASVSLRGFDYPLDHGTIAAAGCLGIGNAVAVSPAMVTLHAGELAVIVFAELEWW